MPADGYRHREGPHSWLVGIFPREARKLCLSMAAALVGLALGVPTEAQLVTTSLEGFAKDRAGAALADVMVTVVDVTTGLEREAMTDAGGYFAIVSLPPEGAFEVRVSKPGFVTVVQQDVSLMPDRPRRLDFTLDMSAAETVVVSGVEPLGVDRDHSVLQQVIPEPLIRMLPVAGRGFLSLASLGAGFTGNADHPNPQGQQYWANNVLVDSASHFSKWRSAPRSFYSGYGLESIAQIQVLTNQFSAEFGEALGSVTIAITKAGTNAWHGSGLLFVRDAAFDATPPFAPRTPPGNGQQFGTSIGGPLVADRTHLFASFEGRRARDQNIVVSPRAQGAFVPDRQDEYTGFVRVDHRLNSRQSLTARYNGQRFRWQHAPGGLTLPGSGTRYRNDSQTLLATAALQLTPRTVHEWRLQFARYADLRSDLNPSVYVSRAGYSAEGGRFGPTGFGADPEDTWETASTLGYFRGRHTVRLGGGLKYVRAHNVALMYSRGAYYFAGDPTLFPSPFIFIQSFAPTPTASTANPRSLAGFGFVQDDFRVGRGVTLNLGVRYDVERVSAVRNYEPRPDLNNVQPRVGLAWDVTGIGRTVFRAGAGVYAQQHLLFPINRVQLEGPDGAVTLTVPASSPLMPSFPSTLGTQPSGPLAPPRDAYRVSSGFHNPHSVQITLGVQQVVFGNVLSADVVHLRGYELMSLVDANAPASVQKPAQRTVEQADATRPLIPAPSTYRAIITLGNEGRSWYRALQVKLARGTGAIESVASYTLSQAEDMADYELPEDSRNLAAEKGRAGTDVRHSASGAVTWDLPGSTPLTRGWSLAGIGTFRSGRPYTVRWGDDRNGTTQNDARPGARNTRRGGAYQSLDVAIVRRFHRGARLFEGRVELFNLFNAVNYDQYVGELLSPLFGRPVSAFPARRTQLAVVTRF